MPPKFGTSGLRGLVVDLTSDLVTDHVRAFVAACPVGTGLYVGRDLRPSSPGIADMVIAAGQAAGLRVTDCGAVPTPALALAAMGAGAAAVMVTGSHIPADRNGLKFYTPAGEITKAHETAILAKLGHVRDCLNGVYQRDDGVAAAYVARYVTAFGADALAGLHVGNYAHSSVGRDILADILTGLGARVTDLGRADHFIPVDTEAVDVATRIQLKGWAAAHQCDAIVSMDGDGDRPLLADASGQVIVGDLLGQITGAALRAAVAVTPVSSNTGAEAQFARVIRTRIGSPFVIAGMEDVGGRVVGYEANGGFLLGFAADGPAGMLPPLMTRDAVLPLIVPLMAARGRGLAAVVAAQPARFTAADRLQDVPTAQSQTLVQALDNDAQMRADFLRGFDGKERHIDRTDGLRITFKDGRIVHLRPSGNAPELRLYAEAESPAMAQKMLSTGLGLLRKALH